MPPPRWATDEQWEWLSARRLEWRQAKTSGQIPAFLAKTYNTWAQLWSERTLLFGEKDTLSEEEELQLGKAVKAKQKNHGGRSNGSDAPERGHEIQLPKVKGTRALQPIEVYSKRYYESKVKPLVEEEIQKRKLERAIEKLSPVERLEIIRQCTRNAFEAESSEIREEIMNASAEEKARSRVLTAACKSATVVQDEERTAGEYQHAIDHAPAMIERALAPIRIMTGGVLTVLWSGPVPEDGGAIGSFAVHQGQTASGHNFAQAMPTFEDAIVRPHVEFARGVFPEPSCGRYATKPKPTQTGQGDTSRPVDSQQTASGETVAVVSNPDVVIPDLPPPRSDASVLSRSTSPAPSTNLSHTSSSPPPESDPPESSPREPTVPLPDDGALPTSTNAADDAPPTSTDTAHLPTEGQDAPTTVDAHDQVLQPTGVPLPSEPPLFLNDAPLNMFAFPQQMYHMDMLGDGMYGLGNGMYGLGNGMYGLGDAMYNLSDGMRGLGDGNHSLGDGMHGPDGSMNALGHGMLSYGEANLPVPHGGMDDLAAFSAEGNLTAYAKLFDGTDPFADLSGDLMPFNTAYDSMYCPPPDSEGPHDASVLNVHPEPRTDGMPVPAADAPAPVVEDQRRSSRNRRPPRPRDLTPPLHNVERPPKKLKKV
ncbi:hypothetical protein ACG7TL_006014 [Trametes sanguinea]